MIELLVVITIIGILAALVLSGVSKAKGKAQRIQCANNVRQLGMGMQLFVSDNQVYPLGVTGPINAGIYTEHDWRRDLEKEFPRLRLTEVNDVWHCPNYHEPPSRDVRIAYG